MDAEVEAKTTAEAVPARVVCILKNGERLEHFIEFPKGCPQNPISAAEVTERFRSVAETVFGKNDCDEWLANAMHAVDLQTIHPLLNLKPIVT